MATVNAGNSARSGIAITADGVPVAASGVTVSYISPTGAVTPLAVQPGDGTGKYFATVLVAADEVSGTAYFQWASTTPATSLSEEFMVDADPLVHPPSCDEWPIIWTCDKPAGLTAEQEAGAIEAARMLLWSRTGRRLGLCGAVDRFEPIPGCVMPPAGWPESGGWRSVGAIFLPNTPVAEIVSVAENGVTLSPSSYRLEGAQLVRLNGSWPSGSYPVEVSYRYGVPIVAPRAGLVALAMGELAAELAAGVCGGVCKLPSRAVSITRQGVTVELGGAEEYINGGLLGLPLSDQLINTVNPRKRSSASQVFSLDMARRG